MELKNNIAFDLDGTLINLITVVERVLKEDHNAKTILTNAFKIETEPELDYETQLWPCFNKAFKLVDEIEPFPGVYEFLSKLHRRTKDRITIITARPSYTEKETHETVKKVCRDIPFKVHIVEDHWFKLDHLKGKFKYYVDDRRKTVKFLAENGIQCFMPVRIYNQPLGAGRLPIWQIREVDTLNSFSIDKFTRRK